MYNTRYFKVQKVLTNFNINFLNLSYLNIKHYWRKKDTNPSQLLLNFPTVLNLLIFKIFSMRLYCRFKLLDSQRIEVQKPYSRKLNALVRIN